MTTNTPGTWIEYTGSDEQITELVKARYGYIVQYKDKQQSPIHKGKPFLEVNSSYITWYWIIPDDPLREMKIRQAQTGQPVWIRTIAGTGSHLLATSLECYYYNPSHTIYKTVNPDWNIPNAEYRFTPWGDLL